MVVIVAIVVVVGDGDDGAGGDGGGDGDGSYRWHSGSDGGDSGGVIMVVVVVVVMTTVMEMGDNNSFAQSHMNSSDEDKFLTEIVHQQQPCFSFESVYHSSTMQHNTANFTTSTIESTLSCEEYARFDKRHNNMLKSNSSSNSINISQDHVAASHKPSAASSSSPNTFIFSFENSTVEPALHRPSPKDFGGDGTCSSILCSKRTMSNHIIEPKAKQGTKKFKSSSETQDHIMAERKRRRELTEKFIALSATIPGLKKTDKAYILREAMNYMKHLQERVKELENQNKRTTAEDSVIFIEKSHAFAKEENKSCETKSLLQVEARVLEKEVLIGIHCEKQKDIVLKIMALLQNLHLSLASSSVLPFGTSTLKVTIIAQMGDKFSMNVNDLVKNLWQDLLKSHEIQN
ncbi:transcription factor bHLH18-like [Gastrolobium bilobum]|uniref:transcription factor bHLH18-like n=1 Tax=Gastrolobium bilobum TaxID=150636 RepID=UPI002AB022CE|nr:transcription factor bHLH18-like [Gastrolobium bilobum]